MARISAFSSVGSRAGFHEAWATDGEAPIPDPTPDWRSASLPPAILSPSELRKRWARLRACFVSSLRCGLNDFFIFSKLGEARSRLYRRQMFPVDIRWKTLDEIYKMLATLEENSRWKSLICCQAACPRKKQRARHRNIWKTIA